MRISFRKERKPNPWRNFVVGLAGGAAGTLAMGYYFQAVAALTKKHPMAEPPKEEPKPLDEIALIGPVYRQGEAPTAALGRILYSKVKGHEPEPQQANTTLSNAVHWSYGTLQGGVYSLWKSQTSLPETIASSGYGTVMWLGSLLVVPALGLSKGPGAFSAYHHIHTLIGHWIYGLTVGCVRNFLMCGK